MKFVGKVKRFCKDGSRKDLSDPYFARYCGLKFNKSVSGLYTSYGLALPNKEAGYLSLRKYDRQQPFFDQKALTKALDWTKKHFSVMLNSDVWDDFDKVKSELNLDASPGFPWTSLPEVKTKRAFYDLPIAKEFLDTYWNDLLSPNAPPVFWTNNVKEEMRSVEKLILNKLRTYTGSPVEHVHSCVRLFGDQNEKFYSTGNSGLHWSFVGGSKMRRGWTKLFRRLSKHPNCFELDESEYDSSLCRELLFFMADFRFSCLKK